MNSVIAVSIYIDPSYFDLFFLKSPSILLLLHDFVIT